MATVAVILPCYGRRAQTLRNAARLVEAAGGVDAVWYAVGGNQEQVTTDALVDTFHWIGICNPDGAFTYWQGLARATEENTTHYYRTMKETGPAPILCAVANDVWAGDNWLANGLAAYHARFPDGEGLMGFAGDGHGPGHSCHFLIGRGLLVHLGGWPVHYQHNFGDTELCQRAQALGRYGKATNAVLEHRHPNLNAGQDDPVYAAGRAKWAEDEALYTARKARGWT